ncbi:glycerophosphodiester phosphodiesterase family protein [Desulfovibrio mangrovi]|uniref:glycerophosphodiester phosphodiesterase n=1 Tax=Desulfovibrio mangrovi TaxID=2976983 RepID=UPI002245CA76|nr:glycerophosphodiester phosphodiesterase family protein [Desulfovibrio mangrovi]UZP69208.1 glycerophosphodiester phosphodiesterase family protein [Desulfovibrio mangrovi]
MLNADKPLIWGHRGCRSLAPENTLASMELAHAKGADGWELDVVLTRDGIPVLLHDLNLLRTTDAAKHETFRSNPPALPWRFTLEELKTLNAGIFPRRRCGRKDWGTDTSFGVQPIPTLEEALRRSAELGLWVNIEIKDVSNAMPGPMAKEIVLRTLDVVARLKMEESVVVSSFNLAYVAECKQHAPHILTGMLTPHAYTGDAAALAQSIKADAWHPGHKRLTQAAIAHVRNAGLAVTPYTVNDPARMVQLIEWGVSGIVTDNPQDVPDL